MIKQLTIDPEFKNLIPPLSIIREGKAYSDGGNKRFARQLLNVYNKKLSTGKLNIII